MTNDTNSDYSETDNKISENDSEKIQIVRSQAHIFLKY